MAPLPPRARLNDLAKSLRYHFNEEVVREGKLQRRRITTTQIDEVLDFAEPLYALVNRNPRDPDPVLGTAEDDRELHRYASLLQEAGVGMHDIRPLEVELPARLMEQHWALDQQRWTHFLFGQFERMHETRPLTHIYDLLCGEVQAPRLVRHVTPPDLRERADYFSLENPSFQMVRDPRQLGFDWFVEYTHLIGTYAAFQVTPVEAVPDIQDRARRLRTLFPLLLQRPPIGYWYEDLYSLVVLVSR